VPECRPAAWPFPISGGSRLRPPIARPGLFVGRQQRRAIRARRPPPSPATRLLRLTSAIERLLVGRSGNRDVSPGPFQRGGCGQASSRRFCGLPLEFRRMMSGFFGFRHRAGPSGPAPFDAITWYPAASKACVSVPYRGCILVHYHHLAARLSPDSSSSLPGGIASRYSDRLGQSMQVHPPITEARFFSFDLPRCSS
jgi:hypothetical protein